MIPEYFSDDSGFLLRLQSCQNIQKYAMSFTGISSRPNVCVTGYSFTSTTDNVESCSAASPVSDQCLKSGSIPHE